MGVDLVILESVKVEDDPLQVHNQHVWRVGNELSLLNVYLLLAVFALKVVDDGALNHLLQTLVQPLAVFHLNTKVVIALEEVPDVPAGWANQLGANLSTKDTFKQMLLAGRFKQILQSSKYIFDFLADADDGSHELVLYFCVMNIQHVGRHVRFSLESIELVNRLNNWISLLHSIRLITSSTSIYRSAKSIFCKISVPSPQLLNNIISSKMDLIIFCS